MNPIQVVAGIIAGLIGAAVWAGIACFAELEVGYVAWGIGLMVGWAVASTGRKCTVAGVGAVLITVVSILAGKYGAIFFGLNIANLNSTSIVTRLRNEGDRALVRNMADEISRQKMDSGEQLEWPAGMTYEEAREPADYPPGIWDAAQAQWDAKTGEEKKEAADAYFSYVEAAASETIQELHKQGFRSSFGALDIIFFGLAIATSWRLASRETE